MQALKDSLLAATASAATAIHLAKESIINTHQELSPSISRAYCNHRGNTLARWEGKAHVHGNQGPA